MILLFQFPSGCYSLLIEECYFLGNEINEGWLPRLDSNFIITRLWISGIIIPISIEDNAFNDDQFYLLNYFILTGNVKYLKKNAFKGLENLQYLEIRIYGTVIEYVEAGILNSVPNILSLQIQCSLDYDAFINFTDNADLQSVLTLDIRNNNFKIVQSETLKVFPNLQQIFMQFSNIEYIHPDAFNAFLKSIELIDLSDNNLEEIPPGLFNFGWWRHSAVIYLHNNRIKYLPEGIFDVAIKTSEIFYATLFHNEWVCDCDLVWLKEMILDGNIQIPDDSPDILCIEPDYNIAKNLLYADYHMCNNTSSTSFPNESTIISSTTTKNPITEITSDPSKSTSTSTNQFTLGSTSPLSTSSSVTFSSIPSTSKTTSISSTIISSSIIPTRTTTSSAQTSSPNTVPITITTSATEITTTLIPTTAETSITTNTDATSTLTPSVTEYTECSCEEGCNLEKINISTKSFLKETIQSMPIYLNFQNITIEEDDVTKELKIQIFQDDYILLWISSDDQNDMKCNFTTFKCETCKLSHSYIAKFKTEPSTSYTLCAVSLHGDPVSPLNCRAHTTLPQENERPWLLNDEQILAWSIFAAAVLVCFICGGFIVYIIIRRYPRLIKGNKRVIIVSQRPWDVMVMPKEYYYTTKSENYTRFRRNSETSYYTARTSSTSYVTAIQPTPVQLISWKFNQMWNRLSSDKSHSSKNLSSKEPPPLPPYPRESSCERNYPYDSNYSCYTKVVTDM